jgi:hypothetical protein
VAKKTKTTLTFQVTIPDLEGAKIPEVRKFILEGLQFAKSRGGSDTWQRNIDLEKVKIHLTNKETSYA